VTAGLNSTAECEMSLRMFVFADMTKMSSSLAAESKKYAEFPNLIFNPTLTPAGVAGHMCQLHEATAVFICSITYNSIATVCGKAACLGRVASSILAK
jgi:hypothetical protein